VTVELQRSTASSLRIRAIERRWPREQNTIEEFANCVSHGIGFLLATAALPILVLASLKRVGSTAHAVAVSVFALTMMLLYLASALFHGLPPGRAKRVFGKVDHSAIYLFIAGSYTPFAATALNSHRAWLLLALVWALAVLGALVTLMNLLTRRLWSTSLYVALGWFVLLSAIPWIQRVSTTGASLLVAGGAAYTLGSALFLLSARLRFAHLGWHIFVMIGSGLHFTAALWHS
jgi:hemolysin III